MEERERKEVKNVGGRNKWTLYQIYVKCWEHKTYKTDNSYKKTPAKHVLLSFLSLAWCAWVPTFTPPITTDKEVYIKIRTLYTLPEQGSGTVSGQRRA